MPVADSKLDIPSQKNVAITGLTLIIAILFGLPILLGLIGIILPASGYFPALDKTRLSIDAARDFLVTPGLRLSSWLSLQTGLLATVISLTGSFVILASFSSSKSISFSRQSHPYSFNTRQCHFPMRRKT